MRAYSGSAVQHPELHENHAGSSTCPGGWAARILAVTALIINAGTARPMPGTSIELVTIGEPPLLSHFLKSASSTVAGLWPHPFALPRFLTIAIPGTL